MAVAFGLPASIATVPGLAIASTKVATLLLQAATNTAEIDDDIRNVARTLRISGSALSVAYTQLKCRDISDPKSSVYRKLKEDGTLVELEKTSIFVKARIKSIPDLVERSKSRVKFIEAFKWLHTRKHEITSLMSELEHINTSVHLILTAARFERNLKDERTVTDPTYLRRLQQEIIALRVELKLHERTAKEQRQLELLYRKHTMGDGDFSSSTESLVDSMLSLQD